MTVRKIGFEALIQQVTIKSLRSGDRSARIVLEIDAPKDSLLNGINYLHRADRLVGVAIAEKQK